MSQGQKAKGGNRKINKNQTEGNVLMFYALQSAASSILNCKVTARGIKFKSPIKAEVQYDCGVEEVSKAQQQEIAESVNHTLSSGTVVSSSRTDSSNVSNIPNGIGGGDSLFDVAFDGKHVGFSHIPISMANLGKLSGFKMIKSSYNTNKKVLKVSYQFVVSSADDGIQMKGQSQNQQSGALYFDDIKGHDKDHRAVYAKELMTLIGTELGVNSIDPVHRDKLFQKVHDVLNQFQNVCYTKGFNAASRTTSSQHNS